MIPSPQLRCAFRAPNKNGLSVGAAVLSGDLATPPATLTARASVDARAARSLSPSSVVVPLSAILFRPKASVSAKTLFNTLSAGAVLPL